MTHSVTQKLLEFQVDGTRLEGDLTMPEDRPGHRLPVVLMLHGFTGSRSEWTSDLVPEGLFGRAAMVWARKGIASLRIDFRGSGASDGDFADMTVHSEIADALFAIDVLKEVPEIDPARIGVVGMSLGGAVASAVAGRSVGNVAATALWNPGIFLPATFSSMLGMDAIRAALKSDGAPIKFDMPQFGKHFFLRRAFFESLYEVVPPAEIARYPGPVFVAIGELDDIVFPQPVSAKALLAYRSGRNELWTSSSDHGFDADRSVETVDLLIEATGRFFSETLA